MAQCAHHPPATPELWCANHAHELYAAVWEAVVRDCMRPNQSNEHLTTEIKHTVSSIVGVLPVQTTLAITDMASHQGTRTAVQQSCTVVLVL